MESRPRTGSVVTSAARGGAPGVSSPWGGGVCVARNVWQTVYFLKASKYRQRETTVGCARPWLRLSLYNTPVGLSSGFPLPAVAAVSG